MADELDSGNKFGVGVSGARIVILKPPTGTITKDDALNLAAWLAVLADGRPPYKFTSLLEAVQNT